MLFCFLKTTVWKLWECRIANFDICPITLCPMFTHKNNQLHFFFLLKVNALWYLFFKPFKILNYIRCCQNVHSISLFDKCLLLLFRQNILIKNMRQICLTSPESRTIHLAYLKIFSKSFKIESICMLLSCNALLYK